MAKLRASVPKVIKRIGQLGGEQTETELALWGQRFAALDASQTHCVLSHPLFSYLWRQLVLAAQRKDADFVRRWSRPGVFAWTIGEAILMPMADRIAPDAEKGAFFGALEIRYLGFFVGPILGGALLGNGIWLYFGVMAVLSFAAWLVLRSLSVIPAAR
ncbi:hypothetical protein ACFQ6Q_26725 [Streptomyces sp. NPDC056437]|uniref:hypothetical protein n=1 Tax=Streptomyces sp. NPDC056437 TaxID=3345816 RepID=UPI0036794FAD